MYICVEEILDEIYKNCIYKLIKLAYKTTKVNKEMFISNFDELICYYVICYCLD